MITTELQIKHFIPCVMHAYRCSSCTSYELISQSNSTTDTITISRPSKDWGAVTNPSDRQLTNYVMKGS